MELKTARAKGLGIGKVLAELKTARAKDLGTGKALAELINRRQQYGI